MRERLGYIARGHIDYGKSTLIVSTNSIEMSVEAKTTEKGMFELTNSAGFTAMKGLVRSTDSRVRVWDDRFLSGTVKIRYEVNAQYEDEGSVIAGFFQIVSSCGEKTVPFRFNITSSTAAQVSEIESLDDLAALAERDEGTAFRLFTSPGFIRLPFMANGNLRVLYTGLTGGVGKRAAMEEFLTGTGAKKEVHLSVNTGTRTYVQTGDQITDSITVTRSTWGYVSINVRADNDFIVFEKNSYSNPDFEGDTLTIPYMIDPTKLHAGKNYGRIKLDVQKKTFSLDIDARCMGTADSEKIIAGQAYLNYQNLYISYLLQDGNQQNLLARMNSELARMRSGAYEASELAEIQHAEVYALQGRTENALLLLEDVGSRVKDGNIDPPAYCYYLYVKNLIESSDSAAQLLMEKLLTYSESDDLPDDIIIFLLLRMDSVMNENPAMKFSQMKGWYRKGCRSAFLFTEAARAVTRYPELILALEPFEQQVLDFCVKHRMATEKLALKAADIAARIKEPSPRFLKTLMALYDERPSKELITAICTVLIRKERPEGEYFKWYRLGVEQDVQLTGLYEHFLYSMPDDYHERWPRMVLLYFSYNEVLDEVAGARLYHYVQEHPEKDPDLAKHYREYTKEFVRRQLRERNINSDLAALYDRWLKPDDISSADARLLPDIVFCHSIRCEAPQITHAVICYEELKDETIAEFHGDLAYAPIYTANARVLLQDVKGNRYESFPVTVRPLMTNEALKRFCMAKNEHDEMIILAAGDTIHSGEENGQKAGESIAYMQKLMHLSSLHPAYRRKIFTELADWYLKHPDEAGGDDFLLSVDKDSLSFSDRAQVIDLMIDKNLLPEAWRLIERYGPAGVDPARLSVLCKIMVQERLFGQDERVLDMAQICFFADTCDKMILEYLCCWYNASSEDMYRLWRDARGKRVDTHDLEERLLGQMLFSGETKRIDEVFMAYVNKSSCDEVIVKAFLAVKSWLYIMKSEDIDREIEEYMEEFIRQTDLKGLPDISLIAVCQSASESVKTLNDGEKALCERIVRRLYSKGYLFSFFSKLSKAITLPEELADRAIVEYRGAQGRNLLIIWHMPGKEDVRSPLPEVFEGVYAVSVSLLYGEEIKYDIYDAGVDSLIAGGSVKFNGKAKDDSVTRTAALNRILEALNADDEEKLTDEMMKYAVTDYLVEKCFTPME